MRVLSYLSLTIVGYERSNVYIDGDMFDHIDFLKEIVIICKFYFLSLRHFNVYIFICKYMKAKHHNASIKHSFCSKLEIFVVALQSGAYF